MVNSIEAGKLVVAAVSLSIDPSGTAAAALGLDITGHIFSKTPDLEALSKELGKKFDARLKEPRFDKPEDARQLLPQMLEAARPDGKGFVESNMDAGKVVDAMLQKLAGRSDYAGLAVQNAFRDLMLPLLQAAFNDPRLLAALSPHLQREVLTRL